MRGDVKLTFFDEDQYSSDDKVRAPMRACSAPLSLTRRGSPLPQMCHLWFHTGFIENNYLCFEKSVIDKACKVQTRPARARFPCRRR